MESNFLANRLFEIKNANMASFHVPGHKNGKLYERLGLYEYVQNLHVMDTTEIEGTDNLHSPSDVIKKAQERASRAFGSDKSFFLVNGTTCGIQAAIMASVKPGEKLIMDRSSHMSAFNACIMGQISTAYIDSKTDEKNAIPLPSLAEDVRYAIQKNRDAKAVYITSPTYYGDVADIEQISQMAHENGMILIVDSAHGSHLELSENLPKGPIASGADICIFSLHKTLSAFTQSSIMHISGGRADVSAIKRFLAMIHSSSPSYILMSSIDVCMGIYEQYGKELMRELLQNIEIIESFLKKAKRLSLYEGYSHGFDRTKIFINTLETGFSGYEIEKVLRKDYGIQIEFATPYGIMIVSSIGNDRSDFNRLKDALKGIEQGKGPLPVQSFSGYPQEPAVKEMEMFEAFYAQRENALFENATGKTSGEYIIPYPPGIPLVVPGEIIRSEVIDYIKTSKAHGMNIKGIKDSRCKSIEIIK
ncbi:arginine decarboxylase [Peptoclostridium litorale DSM 5388]|uniref:Arginine decarboxylase SpeA n=1 Tax=Peptoclostridium litorale DSM 5388 TaxID=1121324 RepID=A0A069RCE4_PEPLI|nr:aminotransferase class I/II-fold pyridoxal phosphate-dependent enzyme [Peptoclostridium litorale]KDR94681.1 arginine decarboxylase SpeA [Peptoclostridium litorale DSM 5388]SIO32548.1 arginine decarboxylase [Peptoclostridium litorale DSM 5388]